MIVQKDPLAHALHTVTKIPVEEFEELYQKYGASEEELETELDKFLTSKGFDPNRVATRALLVFLLGLTEE